MTNDEILDCEFYCNDLSEHTTLRYYFYKLLFTLCDEGEGFSGKRPFGNSGWEFDMFIPLVKCGAVKGIITEDGYVEDIDTKKAWKIIFDLIEHVFKVA